MLSRRRFLGSLLTAVAAAPLASLALPQDAQAQQWQIPNRRSPNFNGPPAPRREARPLARPGYVWVPGYWMWSSRSRRYVWVSGRWERNRPGFRHVGPQWVHRGGEWVFIPGRWVR
ncbi:twin-arginine translocation signal domain-containing protein [Roseixanthobacter pseudopolyaromaticivorans]|uniref:twin-arginine translocation signal domain-containing protein n=1 Tax=Xanthobacteraceae TaxID=335928 RepID=UPI0037279D72